MSAKMKSQKETYKKIGQNRLAYRKLMKVPKGEGNFPKTVNINPEINRKYSTYKRHELNIEDNNKNNPFDIPNHRRLFSTSKKISSGKAKPIPFIMDDPRTVRDVDETFYKIIEGRPLRQFCDVKAYMRNLRDTFLFRANTAYLNDQMLQVNSNYDYELKEFNETAITVEKAKHNFILFVGFSYNNAKKILAQAEEKAEELAKVQDILDSYYVRYVKLKNEVRNSMASFEILLKYGKFLHSLSPISWRIDFDNLNTQIIDMNPPSHLEELDYELIAMASLEDFKNKVTQYVSMSPHIYFDNPNQMIDLFDYTSNQCLNYLKINQVTSILVKSILKSRNHLKFVFQKEQDNLQLQIDRYIDTLTYMENRAQTYKSAFDNLLHKSFRELYSAHDNVKLYTCVQYVHTRVFNTPDDSYDHLTTLMHNLEQEYMDINLAMSYMDHKVVTSAAKEAFAQDIIVMNKAHFAQRALREWEIFKKSLYVSFEPPRQRKFIR